jgi:hypothetical protein
VFVRLFATPREYEMIHRVKVQAFSLTYDLAPPSPPSPNPVSKLACVSSVEIIKGGGGQGVGKEPNYATARMHSIHSSYTIFKIIVPLG